MNMLHSRIRFRLALPALLLAGMLLTAADPVLKKGDYNWMSMIRKDHPRLLFNSETFPKVKARALGAEREFFEKMRKLVDNLPEKPKIQWDQNKLTIQKDGKLKFKAPSYMLTQCMPNIGGMEAARCAFVYLVTGEKKYLEKAKAHIYHSLEVYRWALKNQIMVEWEMRHYIGSFLAYDWIYNDLTPEERTEILTGLYEITRGIQHDNRDFGQVATFRRNRSNYTSGFYGANSLRWYAGLAGYGDGVADDIARRLLELGFDDFMDVMNFRDRISGKDGVLVSACLGYSLTSYPYTSFNFMFTLNSATGIAGEKQWFHMRYFPNWMFWNLIPADFPLEFGVGDAHHTDNRMWIWGLGGTLNTCRHFYGKDDSDLDAMCRYLLAQLPENRRNAINTMNLFLPFLLTDIPENEAEVPAEALPQEKFHYFPSVGLALMRSGNSPDATYALMRAGSRSQMHQHYDEGHFTIYKKGFLALDSGTRALVHNYNLPFYYSQTVAHNAILIHMPGEPIAPYWGEHHLGKYPEPRPLMHGGQSKQCKAGTTTVVTNNFAMVRNDATACYNPGKCKLAIREFFHLRPDLFLVVDRVESTRPEYKKEWLLHFQNEPEITGDTYTATESGGRLTGKVLFPEAFTITKVGGPGKEFFASGHNWPLHPKIETAYIGKLHGNWRIEVAPAQPAASDLIVNLLLAEDVKKPQPFPEVKKSFSAGVLTLEFSYDGKNWQITIPAAGNGHTKITVKVPEPVSKKK